MYIYIIYMYIYIVYIYIYISITEDILLYICLLEGIVDSKVDKIIFLSIRINFSEDICVIQRKFIFYSN